MPDVSLSSDLPSSTQADWEASAAAVLRKARRLGDDDADSRVWDKLTLRTLDGVAITPLGTPALTADVPSAGLPGQAPFVRGSVAARADKAWDVRALHADPDAKVAAEAVLTDLENGVTSLWLALGRGGLALTDLPAVLERVLLDLAPVVLDAPADPVAAADAFLAVLTDRGLTAAPGTSLGADPIGAAVREGASDLDAAAIDALVAQIAERATTHDLGALVVDASAAHDAGASDVQELAYSLAVGAAYLRSLVAAGLDVDDAARRISFRYAATDDQFVTIAKLRAARRLWNRVTELSGVTEEARAQEQHAVTSRPMMSRYDPYVNMLRTTVAAFAAGVGGATSVTVLPFDTPLGIPEAFGRRIARNTSSLLISEAHVAEVTDPAGGAHAVERLTEDLARAAWAELGTIESEGGLPGAGLAGLRARIAQTVTERTAQVATRRRPITGLTEFPNLAETLPARRPHPEGAVSAISYGGDFEALRDTPADTPVFLATMGSIASHTARATFAINLLAAGGVATQVAGATAGVDDVLAAYAAQPVVVLAAADPVYAEWGAELIEALRGAGARWIVVAGKPLEGSDANIAVGTDLLAFHHTLREHLAQPGAATRPQDGDQA
ncbi:methylmalonyl-CoA mutase family protein [Janibacter sp. G1551]|uniref:methylmalonyl-CoA mutase family protein n=1 Tax=Janibacter sp. G1551 TaxID=3420440 RepID=UPI003D06BEED